MYENINKGHPGTFHWSSFVIYKSAHLEWPVTDQFVSGTCIYFSLLTNLDVLIWYFSSLDSFMFLPIKMINSYIMNKNEACVTRYIANVIPNGANSCIYEKWFLEWEENTQIY